MEEKGYLGSYEQEEGGKIRKYYSITKEGKKILKQKKEDWMAYSKAVADVLSVQGGWHEDGRIPEKTDGSDPVREARAAIAEEMRGHIDEQKHAI